MKKTIVVVILLVTILVSAIVLSHHRSAPGPAMQKAQHFKMDNFKLDNMSLGIVIDMLNSLIAKGHGGVELSLAATARGKENKLISVDAQNTNLAEVIDQMAKAADLDVAEKDNTIMLVPKKAP